MRIIYDKNGTLAQLIPAPQYLSSLPREWSLEEKMIYIANKDLPTGTKYEIVPESEIPTDREFRNAWEYVSGPNERTATNI